mmetsp:Transcript_27713/g.50004  ORF Transcript_27713/g.50004 Transcript_27713/m.50004 type:complete len:330 (-) Transcript_27713:308-1297(-)
MVVVGPQPREGERVLVRLPHAAELVPILVAEVHLVGQIGVQLVVGRFLPVEGGGCVAELLHVQACWVVRDGRGLEVGDRGGLAPEVLRRVLQPGLLRRRIHRPRPLQGLVLLSGLDAEETLGQLHLRQLDLDRLLVQHADHLERLVVHRPPLFAPLLGVGHLHAEDVGRPGACPLEIPADGHLRAPPLVEDGLGGGVGQRLEADQLVPLPPLLVAVLLPHLDVELRVRGQVPEGEEGGGAQVQLERGGRGDGVDAQLVLRHRRRPHHHLGVLLRLRVPPDQELHQVLRDGLHLGPHGGPCEEVDLVAPQAPLVVLVAHADGDGVAGVGP